MKRFVLNLWVAALLAAGLQSAALAYIVIDRATLIDQGREIVLDVRPVDPRSLFRGDYVILDYGALSRPDRALLGDLPKDTRSVYVTARMDAEGWTAAAVTETYPESVDAEDVVLKGEMKGRSGQRIRYGIESYFVPEGEGKRLEKLIGKGELKVVVAVGAGGRTGIKGLEVEGRRIYDEPLY